jgi:hypothetical protein
MARRAHPLDDSYTANLVSLVSVFLGTTLIAGFLAALWRMPI